MTVATSHAGVRIYTVARVDTRGARVVAIWDATADAVGSDKRHARVIIENTDLDHLDGPIYMHGESLASIADWFEQAAASIRKVAEVTA
jgi:hypothetical protein